MYKNSDLSTLVSFFSFIKPFYNWFQLYQQILINLVFIIKEGKQSYKGLKRNYLYKTETLLI